MWGVKYYTQLQATTNLDETLKNMENQAILRTGLSFRFAFADWLVLPVLRHANGLCLPETRRHQGSL